MKLNQKVFRMMNVKVSLKNIFPLFLQIHKHLLNVNELIIPGRLLTFNEPVL